MKPDTNVSAQVTRRCRASCSSSGSTPSRSLPSCAADCRWRSCQRFSSSARSVNRWVSIAILARAVVRSVGQGLPASFLVFYTLRGLGCEIPIVPIGKVNLKASRPGIRAQQKLRPPQTERSRPHEV